MELADAFLHHPDDSAATDRGELLLSRLQEGGRIDKDLPVVYWETPDDLYGKLIDQIVQNMEEQTGTRFDEADRHRLWYEAFKNNTDPDTHQVITPYRAEEHGTSNLNALLQRHSNQVFLEKKGEIGGITAADKVIQIVNRTQSNPV